MEVKQYQGNSLQYLAIEPDDYDPNQKYPMVILLHGFGANMGDLAGLTPSIESRGYVYICPNAPLAIELAPGMVGYAWTPPSDMRAADDIEKAAGLLASLVDEATAKYPVESGQIILGGFSQGGMMTYRYGLPNPELFKGLVVLSGVAPDMEMLKSKLPQDKAQQIFIAHGTADDRVDIQGARDSRDFLEAEGYKPKYAEYQGMVHTIGDEVMNDLVPWIHEVLPPLRLSS